MNLSTDDFTLFGLPQRFALQRADVDARWKALQGEVHPDRFAAQGVAARRVAMQWAVRVNEAYRRLKDPLRRAAYLCELRGTPIDAESNTAMPGDFLAQQMHWRESLDEAAGTPAIEAPTEHEARLRRVGLLLDERGDAAGAAREVRALMFIERFAEDIEQRMETLGQ